MFKKFRKQLASFISPEYRQEIEIDRKEIDMVVNQRVAKIITEMDPFEPLMKEFHGIFSEEFEHPEYKLVPQDQISMWMWGYQQKNDRHFKYMTDWIMNTYGNEAIKKGHPTPETILYGRAQISSMILYRKEVGRLSSLYEDLLEKRKGNPGFDPTKSVE